MPRLGPPDHDELLAGFYDEHGSTKRTAHSPDGLQPSPSAETQTAKPTKPTLFSIAIRGFFEEFKRRTKDLHDPDAVTQVLEDMLQELQLVFEEKTPANILVDDSLPSVEENIYSGLPPAGTPNAHRYLYITRE